MSNTLSKVIIFAAGAAIGSVVTWKVIKNTYEQRANKEINEILERFGGDKKEEAIETDNEEKEEEDSDKIAYDRITRMCGYTTKKEDENMEVDRPYVISPEEFDDNGYNTMTLFYYNNDILVDEGQNIIEGDELENLIGSDALNHFGEYEDDSVFVRNDAMRMDIEILKDEDDYEVR